MRDRVERELLARTMDRVVRARPGFRNVEWWDGDVFMVQEGGLDNKRCARCDKLKSIDDFYTKTTRRGTPYTSSKCKPCLVLDRKEHRWRNIEHERAVQRACKARQRLRMKEAA